MLRHAIFAVILSAPPLAAASGAGAEVRREMRLFDLRGIADEPEARGVLPPPPVLRKGSWDDEEPAFSDPRPHDSGEGTSGSTRLSPGEVRSAITKLIDAESWRNARNTLEVDGARLVALQTPEVLERISRLLSVLEARAGRLFTLDLALVPPEALEHAAPGAARPGASPWLEPDAFELAVGAAPADAVLLSALVREGAPSRLEPGSVSLWVGRYDVNQTGVIPVMNPEVTAEREGAHGEAVIFSAPGGAWFRCDLRLGLGRLRGEPERRRVLYGDLDLPSREAAEVRGSFAVPEGKTALVGLVTAPAPAGGTSAWARAPSFAALLRIRRASPAARAVEAARGLDGVPHVLDAAILLRPLPGSAARPAGDTDGEGGEGGPRPIDPEILLKTVAALFPGEREEDVRGARLELAGSTLFVRGTDAEAERVRARLEELARERSRTVVVDLWQGEASAAELAGAGGGGTALLEPAWLERIAGRPGVRARVLGVAGVRISLASLATRSYVADLNMVSGGTASRLTTVGEPEIGIAGAGLVLSAECGLVPGSALAELEVRGEYARPPVFGRTALARGSLQVEPAHDAKEGAPKEGARPGVKPSGEFVTLDLPDEDSDRWQHLVTVPLGRPILLNALPQPSAPGKTRALVAVAHAPQ